jgi:hypothetical protein
MLNIYGFMQVLTVLIWYLTAINSRRRHGRRGGVTGMKEGVGVEEAAATREKGHR